MQSSCLYLLLHLTIPRRRHRTIIGRMSHTTPDIDTYSANESPTSTILIPYNPTHQQSSTPISPPFPLFTVSLNLTLHKLHRQIPPNQIPIRSRCHNITNHRIVTKAANRIELSKSKRNRLRLLRSADGETVFCGSSALFGDCETDRVGVDATSDSCLWYGTILAIDAGWYGHVGCGHCFGSGGCCWVGGGLLGGGFLLAG